MRGSIRQSTSRPSHSLAPKGNPEISFTVVEADEILPFLLKHLQGRGRNKVKAMLQRSQVLVDGKAITRHDHPLRVGDTVRVNLFKPKDMQPLRGVRLVYEDVHLLVVDKAAGLLSIATDKEKHETAYRQIQEYLDQGDVPERLFIVHRLDRDTSGLMLFAKSEKVKQEMQDHWKDYVSQRVYTVLVEGSPSQLQGTVTSWLRETKTLQVYSSQRPGDGDLAITHYQVLQSGPEFSLLEARLETGRKNQIRVHMQDIGHPVVGDKRYGATANPIGRLGLHARVLSFRHPVSQEMLEFETPIPPSFLRMV